MKDKFRFQSQFLLRFNNYAGNVILPCQFVSQSIKLFLGLLENQRRAFHAVVVLRHVLFDDQALVTLADNVLLVPRAVPPPLGGLEAGGYEKAFQLGHRSSP